MAFSLLLDENFNSTFSKDDFEDVLSFISSVDNNVNSNMQVIKDYHNDWSRGFGLVNSAQTMHTKFCDNQQGHYAEMSNLAHHQQDASPPLQSFGSFELAPKTTATNDDQPQNDKMSFSMLGTSLRPDDTRECSTLSNTESGDSHQLIDVSSILHTTNDFIHAEPQVKDSALDLPYEPSQKSPHLCNLNNRNTTTSMFSSDTMYTLPYISKQQDIFSPIIQSLNNDIINKCSLVSLLESIRNKVQKDHDTFTDGLHKGNNTPSISINYSESPPSSLPQMFVQNTSECPYTNMISAPSSSYQPSFSNNELTTQISQCSNNSDVSSCPLLEPPVATEYGYDSNDILLPLSTELMESGEILNKNQQQNHIKVGPYTCPEDNCLEVFKSKQGLNLHKLKKHKVGKLYKCDECEFKTPRRKDLHGHLVSQHKKLMPGMKVYECKFCSYKCVDRQRLLEHEVIHTGIKQFSCPDCAKCYTTKRGLRTHFKFHSSDRPHKCNLCDADFKVKSKLTDHLNLVHYKKGEKPFLCGYCEHRASIRGNVNQHIRNIHKGKAIIVLVSEEKKSKRTRNYSYTTLDRSGEKSMK